MTPPKEKTRLPTVTIPESEILDWHRIGWHFDHTDESREGYCVMQWRSDSPPVEPFREDVEERQLVSAVAAMEGRVGT